MVLRGYCPSISLGFEILLAGLNIILGVGIIAIGIMCIVDPVEAAMGMSAEGWTCVGLGFLVLSAGVLGMMGSCGEMPRAIRYGTYCSAMVIIAGSVIAGMAYSSSKSMDNTLRIAWAKVDDAQRNVVEKHLGCCGYSSTTDKATDGCESETPCHDILVQQIGDMYTSVAMFVGIAAGVQILAATCGCCVFRKMKKQQKKDATKERKRMLKEGRKIEKEKHKRSKRMAKYREQEAKKAKKERAKRDATGPSA